MCRLATGYKVVLGGMIHIPILICVIDDVDFGLYIAGLSTKQGKQLQ